MHNYLSITAFCTRAHADYVSWAGVVTLNHRKPKATYDKTLLEIATGFRAMVAAIQDYMVPTKNQAVLNYAAMSYLDPWLAHLLPLSEYYSSLIYSTPCAGRNHMWSTLYNDLSCSLIDHPYRSLAQAKVRFAVAHYPYCDTATTTGVNLLRHQLRDVAKNSNQLLAACDTIILDIMCRLHCSASLTESRTVNSPTDVSQGCASPVAKLDRALSLYWLPLATVRAVYAAALFFLHLKVAYLHTQTKEIDVSVHLLQSVLYLPLSLLTDTKPKCYIPRFAAAKKVTENVINGYVGTAFAANLKSPYSLPEIIALLRAVCNLFDSVLCA